MSATNSGHPDAHPTSPPCKESYCKRWSDLRKILASPASLKDSEPLDPVQSIGCSSHFSLVEQSLLVKMVIHILLVDGIHLWFICR